MSETLIDESTNSPMMQATVGLLIADEANRRLLAEHLPTSYEVHEIDVTSLNSVTFDICLVDAPSVQQAEAALIELKNSKAPQFLPYLFFAGRLSLDQLPQKVWTLFDEVVTTPTNKLQLNTRIMNLLKQRQLSVESSNLTHRAERSEELLKKTQRMAAIGGWEFRPDEEELRLTDECRRILGFEFNYEVTLGEMLERYRSEGSLKLSADIKRAVEAGESFDRRLPITTAADEWRWVRVSGQPYEEHDGAVILQGTVQDVTDRRRQKEQLQALTSNVPVVLFALDEEGVFTSIEGQGLPEIDLTVRDLVGESAFDLYAGTSVADDIQRTIEGEQVHTVIEYEGRYFEVWYEPVASEHTTDNQVVGVAVDVTLSEQQERELKQRNEQLRAIIENAPMILFALDREGVFTYVEGQGLAGTTLEPHGHEGECVFDVYDGTAIAENARRALNGERVQSTVEVDEKRFETWYEPVGDESVRDHQVTGVSIDVTDLKQRERELRKEQAFVESLFDAIPDILYAFDEERNMLRSNNELSALTGYSDDEIDEMAPLDFIADEYAEVLQKATHQTFDEGAVGYYEVELITKTDEHIPVGLTTAPILDGSGAIVGVTGTGRDISERVEQERELLRQNERLEEFATVVAHDLRNPLSVASGNLELGREVNDNEFFEAAAKAHHRMNRLIEDVLTLARGGETVIKSDIVSVEATAEQAWSQVFTVDASLNIEKSGTISADQGRLEAVFENLFRNAIEHGGDDVTVRVGPIGDGGFFVADSGPGIPADDREEVFEAGYSTAFNGTGFGLAIVGQIVDAHGWQTRVVESETGGARFEFMTENHN